MMFKNYINEIHFNLLGVKKYQKKADTVLGWDEFNRVYSLKLYYGLEEVSINAS